MQLLRAAKHCSGKQIKSGKALQQQPLYVCLAKELQNVAAASNIKAVKHYSSNHCIHV